MRFPFFFKTTFAFVAKKAVEALTKYHKKLVRDQDLAQKLVPNYAMGCKRVTPSDTYLQVSHRIWLVTKDMDLLHQFLIRLIIMFSDFQQRECPSDNWQNQKVHRKWNSGDEWWQRARNRIGHYCLCHWFWPFGHFKGCSYQGEEWGRHAQEFWGRSQNVERNRSGE